MMSFWYGNSGMVIEPPCCPPLPPPVFDAAGLLIDDPSPESGFVRSSESVPEDKCCSSVAEADDDPGLVVPNAQISDCVVSEFTCPTMRKYPRKWVGEGLPE